MKGFVCSALSVVAILASCKPQTTGDVDAAANGKAPQMDLGVLTKGILSAPNSPQRKQAGAMLSGAVKVAFAQMEKEAPLKDPNQAMMRQAWKSALLYTADYLRNGQTCQPAEKIRLYRGVGGDKKVTFGQQLSWPEHGGVHFAPYFRRFLNKIPDQSAGGYYNALVNSNTPVPMKILATPEHAKQVAAQFADIAAGPTVEKRDKIYAFFNEVDPGFGFALGMGRTYVTSMESGLNTRNANMTPIMGMFDMVAKDHTAGAPWDTTVTVPYSPLVSTTLDKMLPVKNNWGPNFLVLDVCPERAMILMNPAYLEEKEVYVPLFLLPEEITEIVYDSNRYQNDIQRVQTHMESCYLDFRTRPGYQQETLKLFYESVAGEGDYLKARARLGSLMTERCRIDSSINDPYKNSGYNMTKTTVDVDVKKVPQASGDFPAICETTRDTMSFQDPAGKFDIGRFDPAHLVFPARPGTGINTALKIDFAVAESDLDCTDVGCKTKLHAKFWQVKEGRPQGQVGIIWKEIILPANLTPLKAPDGTMFRMGAIVGEILRSVCK